MPGAQHTHPTVSLVTSEAQLQQLEKRLQGEPSLTVDTEFHAERRYFPQLLLLQVAAASGEAWIIDPLAVPPTALRPLLDDRPWVAHGAANDLRVLHHACGARPSALLDTQVLAGMTGHPYPARLGDLCRDVLGLAVDKSAVLEDWSKRPLPPHQLAYAAADARLTRALAEALLERAGDRAAWAWAAGLEAIDEALNGPDTDLQWQQLEVAARLDAPARAALSALFAWREREAIEQNQQPHSILNNNIALDLARRRPTSLPDMARNRRLPPALVKRHGAALLRVLQRAAHPGEAPPPAPGPSPTAATAPTARLLSCWAEAYAAELGVAAGLLLPEGLRQRLALQWSPGVEGWRAEAIGPHLEAFRAGEALLRFTPAGPALEPRSGPRAPDPAAPAEK